METQILITLTSPSCGGKTHLIQHVRQAGFPVLVSCTTRPPRANEYDGVDYYFLSKKEFEQAEADEKFIETNTFNEHKYGVKINEFNLKTSQGPTFLIAEPHGVNTYEKYCVQTNSTVLKYFVYTAPEIRMHRFTNRAVTDFESLTNGLTDIDKIASLVTATISRIVKSQTEEAKWFEKIKWNRVLSGTDEPKHNLSIILRDIDNVKSGKYIF